MPCGLTGARAGARRGCTPWGTTTAATASDTGLVQELMVLCRYSPTKLFKTLQISQNIEGGSRWIIIFFNLEDFQQRCLPAKTAMVQPPCRGSGHPRELKINKWINKCCELSLKTKQAPYKISAKRPWVYMLWMEIRLATLKRRCIFKKKQTNQPWKESLPYGKLDQQHNETCKTWSSALIKMGFSVVLTLGQSLVVFKQHQAKAGAARPLTAPALPSALRAEDSASLQFSCQSSSSNSQ